MLFFRNDYGNGAHPAVMEALCKTNLELTVGYGMDPYCQKAAELIRVQCACPHADVHFIPGGTQANKTAIGAFLRPWEAVISADTGHIHAHEAGAIEHNGHRLYLLPTTEGKLQPEQIEEVCRAYQHEETAAEPKLVYISNTTELGTVYSLAELAALRAVCDRWGLYLYCDGARLACAMAVESTTLADHAAYCHAFTVGGTKNGLLFGEALVITEPALKPSFRRCMKQQGAILAKGRLLGVQYAAILEGGLYMELGRRSMEAARMLTGGLRDLGIPLLIDSPSNQIFPVLPNGLIEKLGRQVSFEHWSAVDENSSCIRLVTAWHTSAEEVAQLLAILQDLLTE